MATIYRHLTPLIISVYNNLEKNLARYQSEHTQGTDSASYLIASVYRPVVGHHGKSNPHDVAFRIIRRAAIHFRTNKNHTFGQLYSLPLIGIFDLVSAIEARRIEKRGESIFMQQRYSNLTDMPFSERFCAGYILLVKSVHLIPQVLTLIVGISSYIYSGSPWGILYYYVVVLLGAAVNSYKLKLLKEYGSISSGRLLLYVILQATPFLDFISALYLWRQYRKSGIYVE